MSAFLIAASLFLAAVMCGSTTKKQAVRADQVHSEEGGFHLLEVNSPINISGSTWVLIALIAGAAGVVIYYCYRKEEREDERRRRRPRRERSLDSLSSVESPRPRRRRPRTPAHPDYAALMPLFQALAGRHEPAYPRLPMSMPFYPGQPVAPFPAPAYVHAPAPPVQPVPLPSAPQQYVAVAPAPAPTLAPVANDCPTDPLPASSRSADVTRADVIDVDISHPLARERDWEKC